MKREVCVCEKNKQKKQGRCGRLREEIFVCVVCGGEIRVGGSRVAP